jgi:hypothetical protein
MHYDIELMPDESGKQAARLSKTKQPRPGTRLTHPGVYCLRSSETDWNSEQLWSTYIMLTYLEVMFRSLKSERGLCSVYHDKEIRVDGHPFNKLTVFFDLKLISN